MVTRATPVALGLVFAVAAVGCSPVPSPSPSIVATGPTAAPLCVFEVGKAAETCTQAQYDELKSKDALYVEAEAVLRAMVAEDERISRAGSEVTSALLATVTGDMAAQLTKKYKEDHQDQVKSVGGTFELKFLRKAPGHDESGSLVTLDYCLDATSVRFYQAGEDIGGGRKIRVYAYFSRVEATLRIFNQHGTVGSDVC